jgi:outer membrane protein TolC
VTRAGVSARSGRHSCLPHEQAGRKACPTGLPCDLSRAAVLVLLALSAGCRGPKPDLYHLPPGPPPWAHQGTDAPRPPERSPVVPAAHAQPIPPPRPAVPEPTLGAGLPDPPTPPPAVRGAAASAGGPLTLAEVLDAVERHYPLLRAVEQERAVAGGRLLSTLGVFDLNLTASADAQGTTYDNFRSSAGLSQGLPFAGVGAFLRYRNGYGDFPTYNLGQKTADGGEVQAGISLPLLQNRAIDRPRANVRQAQIDVLIAEPTVERQRLDFQRAASRTYWNWVAAGQRLRYAEALVRLAVDRDDQLKRQIAATVLSGFELVDNQQNVALRNGVLVQAQRAFQQAAIELSLFLRDEAGCPTIAGVDRLPDFPDVLPVEAAEFEAALRAAAELRPEPRRLRLQRERVAVELRLAENQTLPAVNAVVAAAQDVGPGRSSLSGPNGLDRTTVTGGLAFGLPLQRRDARGRALAAQAQIAQLDQQLRQAEDVVRAEVQDTFSALERAYEFYRQARARVELARAVAEGERQRLAAGRSDVLRVTLREQAAFDAEVIAVGAQQEYFRALADFRAATGVGGR